MGDPLAEQLAAIARCALQLVELSDTIDHDSTRELRAAILAASLTIGIELGFIVDSMSESSADA